MSEPHTGAADLTSGLSNGTVKGVVPGLNEGNRPRLRSGGVSFGEAVLSRCVLVVAAFTKSTSTLRIVGVETTLR